uniref:Uncharacterized protein n=1 Tax=Faecalibaculum rodentium TaxID=1702221 RepID=A0A140DX55_9FIRM|nr:hypothetical protein AALO17_20980 [Faecalibaculum rodentium]
MQAADCRLSRFHYKPPAPAGRYRLSGCRRERHVQFHPLCLMSSVSVDIGFFCRLSFSMY